MIGDGCVWRIHHRAETESTNKDALGGMPGDVFTADYQTAGRGRLSHRWLSPPGENLTMSVVVDVAGVSPEAAATLPLVAGLAAAEAVEECLAAHSRTASRMETVAVKWPNDVLVGERKICGILCERNGDRVIAGMGVNVNQRRFADEIDGTATSLFLESGGTLPVERVRDVVLRHLAAELDAWRTGGFRAVWPKIRDMDFLKGRVVTIARTDDDVAPTDGLCGGISEDGSLLVGGNSVYAGSALWR